MDLDIDILGVSSAGVVGSTADWLAQTLTNVAVDDITGAVTLAESTPVSLFSQTADHSVKHGFTDGTVSGRGPEELALDFFPSPAAVGGSPITLDSIDLYLGLTGGSGSVGAAIFLSPKVVFTVSVGYYDESWRLIALGDPIVLTVPDMQLLWTAHGGSYLGGVVTIPLRGGRRFVFEAGKLRTRTGPGLDQFQNTIVIAPDSTGASNIISARGLSISIVPTGPNFQYAWAGAATSSPFDTTQFWRVAANRNMGPYDPATVGYGAADTLHNPDGHLTTGAVPGYGAKAVTNGAWGIARRITTDQRGQDANNGWHQPYHSLKVVSYVSSGTAVATIDLGDTPTDNVQVRLSDVQPAGTSITYALKGKQNFTDGWTSIGTVTDGEELTGSNLYRYYQLTATLTAGSTLYATPALLVWQMVEQVTLSTYRYLDDFDATSSVDPVTGQAEVLQLKLPILKPGVKNFRDLATMLGSQFAPSSLEAHLFARDTIGGTRLFLNSFRLEDREPGDGVENMTFLGGLDQLTAMLPPSVESYRYPAGAGTQGTISAVDQSGDGHSGDTHVVHVAGATDFSGTDLSGMRYDGKSGVTVRSSYIILSNTAGTFAINVVDPTTGVAGPPPTVGDTFEIHSGVTSRGPLTYAGQEFSAIAADLLDVQSGIPARYRGQLPPSSVNADYPSGRFCGAYTLPAEGAKGSDIFAAIGLHNAGAWQWIGGRIAFFDIYSPKDSLVTWDERHYIDLETNLGADRRMPSIISKYAYRPATSDFAGSAEADDSDALLGWGLSNLFDKFTVPDDVCAWNDAAGDEATFLNTMLQRAWKTGVGLWKVNTAFRYPWLTFGNAVTIVTDQYTDRRLQYAADGVTDIGSPVYGRVSAVGAILGMNLWGDQFIVGIRGLNSVTSAPNATGPYTLPTLPAPILQVAISATGVVSALITGNPGTVAAKAFLFTGAAQPDAGTVAVSGTATTSGQRVGTVPNLGTIIAGEKWTVAAIAYDQNGQASDMATTGDTWDGRGVTPPATIVVGTPVVAAGMITYPVQLDAVTTELEVYELEETHDATKPPTSVENRVAAPKKSYIVGQAGVTPGGLIQVGLPIAIATNDQLASFVPYFGNVRGQEVDTRTQGAGGSPPSTPGKPTLGTPIAGSNSISVTATAAGSGATATKYRPYLNGAAQTDVTKSGSSQTLVFDSDNGITPSTGYRITVSEITSTGVEGPQSDPQTITTAADTSGGGAGTGANGKLPTSTISGVSYPDGSGAFIVDAETLSSMPAGATLHVGMLSTSSGSDATWIAAEQHGAALLLSAPGASDWPLQVLFDQQLAVVTRWFKVWATAPGYTQSDLSAAVSGVAPKLKPY
jgi:hypothetical protein